MTFRVYCRARDFDRSFPDLHSAQRAALNHQLRGPEHQVQILGEASRGIRTTSSRLSKTKSSKTKQIKGVKGNMVSKTNNSNDKRKLKDKDNRKNTPEKMIPNEFTVADNLIAAQLMENVILIAQGKNNTSGYKVFLEKAPLDVFPPEYHLMQTPPSEMVLNVITPFTVTASFHSKKVIKTLLVKDSSGKHSLEVLKIIPEV